MLESRCEHLDKENLKLRSELSGAYKATAARGSGGGGGGTDRPPTAWAEPQSPSAPSRAASSAFRLSPR